MFDLQQRNEAFLASLDTLNPAQRAAVEQVEGPVLVIAGPGTGKTHLLTARIGNILIKTDARPQNILCLTFTDAGATAMRQRLLSTIGPEAQRVPIFTFHAFCNRVIQENAEYFSKGSPEPATELERIEIVRNLLTKLSPEHPLRLGKKDIFQFEEHLRDLFSTMKKEGWSPGLVLKRSEEFLKELPFNPAYIYQRNGKGFKKGDPKQAQILEMTEKIERLKSAADLFPKYLHAMEKAERYEFEDMILWVTRAFEKQEALLRTYQERYQYILVDEFQDTNGAQFHLLNLLLDFWSIPNIFIVGDDDQSIYEFQGARLQNLREFQLRYEEGLKTIVLEDNYRSDQAILDAASRVIEYNTLRVLNLFGAGMTKTLRSRIALASRKNLPSLGQDSVVGIKRLPNRIQETMLVVHQIESLIAQGVPASEIAVLYARHRQAERLLSLFEKKGIPFQTKRPVNILDLPVIQHFRSLLGYLKEESERPFSGEHRLFKLLHAAFWGHSEMDLAQISLACHASLGNTRAQISEPNEQEAPVARRIHWREILNDAEALQQLALTSGDILRALGSSLNTWISDAQNLPLSQLIERLYAQTGLIQWALEQPDKAWYLQVLHTFLEFVRNETIRNPRRSLAKLLDLLDSMDDNRLSLPLSQPTQLASGVQLLTAHAAKGLEFSYVFMLDCTEDTWDKNSGGNRGHFFLPETLTRSGEEDILESRRRLFYVAMTRAKFQLQISFSGKDDAGKSLTQSQFVSETGLPIQDAEVPSPVLLELQTNLLMEAPQPVVSLPAPALLDALLADFTLSVTALNRYLRCPLAFYYEDILKVPATTTEATAFGTVLHASLQQFLLKMKSHPKHEWPSSEVLSKIFGQEMERQRGYFSEDGFTQRLALGKDFLRRLHVEQLQYWRKRAISERRIDRVELNGIPLKGIIDKIEWLDQGTLRIVDYKTGTPDLKKVAQPSEDQPFGGEYWRQLAFYQLLLEKAHLYPEAVDKTAISWLEPDKRGTFLFIEIRYSQEALKFVEGLIRDVYEKIQHRAFEQGCGKKECPWCQMQLERSNAIPLNRNQEADLDDAG